MFYVYVLKSLIDGSYYKGRTTNVERRLKEHQNGKTQSNRIKKPFKLVHVELTDNLEGAKNLELYFKSGFGRENIKEIDADVAELVYAQP
ncbi:MAG TPA: GIY-YIG nuclease family protein [Candidatus Wunengus sp. YC60]|uniref:GIY-YIG nuclease family protein n=1 Tax=Candidatus Wunengus sp. YC60 TaxID=3367697 RepID=UPI0040268571